MRFKNVDSTSDMFLKNFIPKLTSCGKIGWQTHSYQFFWPKNRLPFSLVIKSRLKICFLFQFFSLRFLLFKEELKCYLWHFYDLILQTNYFFESEICNGIRFYEETQFYLKTWIILKLLNGNLTRKNVFFSKTDELWKSWWGRTLISNFLLKNCFLLQLFSEIHSLKKAHNCRIWRFYVVKSSKN